MPDSVHTSKPTISVYRIGFYISVLLPVIAAMIIYQLEPFNPASLPLHELAPSAMVSPRRNSNMLLGSELIGAGKLIAPEDMIYDDQTKVLYTGCHDGWIKKIKINQLDEDIDNAVEEFVRVSGRPLGLAFGHHDNIIVADAEYGLLNVSKNGHVVGVLTRDADGVPFKLTDAVDVAKDGMIYFTDASYKYSLKDYIWDVLEGKPHGRLMSFDPSTGETKVLVRDLYFANGVAVSPDQRHLIYCETIMSRCRKYHLKGGKKGSVEEFTDHLPGLPDNVHYDGHGHYLIALSTEITFAWKVVVKYVPIRKIMAIIARYIELPNTNKNGGVFIVDLEGNPKEHYYDIAMSLISSGIKVGDHLYCSSLANHYIIKLNVTKYPAQATM